MAKSPRVAIIGAGACGLVCAKVLLDDGFDVTLFDRQRELGGIWSAESAYLGLHSQQPGGTLEFSDLYYGEEYSPWEDVHNYLENYANLFKISERIRFETRVLSISKENLKDANLPWIIQSETINGEKSTNQFDLVVVASGLHSSPYVPFYPGEEKFCGSIVSPFAIKSTKQLENKRVIIVGFGKCATDLAVLVSRYASSCYLLFRQAHWMISRRIFGGLLPTRVMYTHALSAIFSPMPDAPYGSLLAFLHRHFPRFFAMMADNIGKDIMSVHGADISNDKIYVPRHSFRNIENISMIPLDFISFKREGRFIGKLGTIEEIVDGTTVRLNSGEELQADLIISATGFIRHFPFFSKTDAQTMGLLTNNGDTQLHLYRRILPVGIPNIAFVGFIDSVANWTVAEVASHWISDYFLQRIQLPTLEQMHQEIERTQTFLLKLFNRDHFHYRYYWAAPVETYFKDMGLNLHRTNNWISEYFGIYRPQRLKGLHHERQIIARTGHQPRHFYFSFTLNIFLIFFLVLIYTFFSFALISNE